MGSMQLAPQYLSQKRRNPPLVFWLAWIVVVPGALRAENAAISPAEKQRISAAKQQEAARRQAGNTSAAGSFFTVPWLTAPLPLVSPATQAMVASADCDSLPSSDLDRLVLDASQQHGVDTGLIRAVIDTESAGRPCAVSIKGAQGLMQLMPATQLELGVSNPFDPAENVGGGTRYLKQLLGTFAGDLRLTLAAYNAGPGRVVDGKVPDIPEVTGYVTSIMSKLKATKVESF
jgi:soluble lytic murein transglycosylase-like protein